MKKLIFSLLSLFAASPVLAEEAVTSSTELAEEVVAASTELANIPLLTKGLIVTAGGLGGVFLVLILFFLMIKVMGKLLK